MLVLFNGHIYTQDVRQPHVSALLIQDGKIIAAGNDDEILQLAAPGSKKINLDGKTVWPGLTDAHMHFEYVAMGLTQVATETDTKAECLRRVAERAKITPPGSWIVGWGWNQNVWSDGYGTAADLDRAAGNIPVYLQSKSGHAGWANTAALQKAGITAATPDPESGVIQRDSSGQPTGIVFENAMALIDAAVPRTTLDELRQAILAAQVEMWKMGLTGLHDYDSALCFAALQALDLEDKLRLRVVKGIPLELLPQAAALRLRSGFGSNYVTIGSVKMFADGALGPQTAAMFQPYENSTDTGILMMDAEQAFEHGQLAASSGLSLATHAIGDHAIHEIINGYEHLREYEKQNHLPALRHRIEHVQILHQDDFARMVNLNIIASMQPIHATSDIFIADKHWGKRSARAYALRTLTDLGAHMAFGSDAPVETPNPFVGIHAAVTRCRADGTPGEAGWYPEQRLTLQQALDGYTTGPAYAGGLEKRVGKLAAGYFADLIVLKTDPFSLPPQELHRVKPAATMVNGEWVWQE